MSITDLFDNGVTQAVRALDRSLTALDDEAMERIKAASVDAPEFELREFMARMFAAGNIPHPEAQTLYAIAEKWIDATTAERVIWYQFCHLLAERNEQG